MVIFKTMMINRIMIWNAISILNGMKYFVYICVLIYNTWCLYIYINLFLIVNRLYLSFFISKQKSYNAIPMYFWIIIISAKRIPEDAGECKKGFLHDLHFVIYLKNYNWTLKISYGKSERQSIIFFQSI